MDYVECGKVRIVATTPTLATFLFPSASYGAFGHLVDPPANTCASLTATNDRHFTA